MAASAAAQVVDQGNAIGERGSDERTVRYSTICGLIESAALQHRIPGDFLARLIWKESSFRAGAVSPKGAQGIAQFMPLTAEERGLADPFDPAQAIPKSAEFLGALRDRFGNLGLAAAAYNAGPKRVEDWLDGQGTLPGETQDYVLAITGRDAQDWAPGRSDTGEPHPPESVSGKTSCMELALLATRPLSTVASPGAARPSPWAVQVAGNFSRPAAMKAFAAFKRKHSAVLGEQEPSVIAGRAPGRGRGTFYRVHVGAQTREGAEKLCGRLRAAGGSCIVLRN